MIESESKTLLSKSMSLNNEMTVEMEEYTFMR